MPFPKKLNATWENPAVTPEEAGVETVTGSESEENRGPVARERAWRERPGDATTADEGRRSAQADREADKY